MHLVSTLSRTTTTLWCTLLITCGFGERITKCTNKELSITCPSPKVIQIRTAQFGHPREQRCGHVQGHCKTDFESAWELCQNKEACSMVVRQSRNDSCQYRSKYLSVEYECLSVSCPTLPPIVHGSIEYSQPYLTYGQSATYRCEEGYTLTGPEVRYCDVPNVWTGIEPACSKPSSLCPPSNDTVFTFEDTCYETVPVSVTYTEAKEDCKNRGWTLLNGSNMYHLDYISEKLAEQSWYQGVWLGQDAERSCQEFHRWRNNGTWIAPTVDCTVLNRYICSYEIQQLPVSMRMPETTSLASGSNDYMIIVGVVVGLLALMVLLVVVIAVVYKRKSRPAVGGGRSEDMDDVGIYYDEAASATSVSEQGETTLPGVFTKPRYSQVKKPKKTDSNSNETTDYDYDPVYAPDKARSQAKLKSHSYENMPHNGVIASLKKRIDHANSEELVYANETEPEDEAVYMNGGTEQTAGKPNDTKDEKISPRREPKKPKPAPKPAIPSTIGKPAVQPDVSQKTETIRRENKAPATLPRGTVTSELDLLENDLYVSKK